MYIVDKHLINNVFFRWCPIRLVMRSLLLILLYVNVDAEIADVDDHNWQIKNDSIINKLIRSVYKNIMLNPQRISRVPMLWYS